MRALALAVLFLTAPAAALAQPASLFATFKRACLDTRADSAKVAQVTPGWREVRDFPAARLRQLGGPFTTVTVRTSARSQGADGLILAVGRKEAPGGSVAVCTLFGPADAGASAASLQGWVGVEGVRNPFGAVYQVIDAEKGRRPATPAEAADKANWPRLSSVSAASVPSQYTILSLTTGFAPQR